MSRFSENVRHTSNFEGLSGKFGSEIANKNIQDEPEKVFFLELDDSGTTTSQSFSRGMEVQWIPAQQQ